MSFLKIQDGRVVNVVVGSPALRGIDGRLEVAPALAGVRIGWLQAEDGSIAASLVPSGPLAPTLEQQIAAMEAAS